MGWHPFASKSSLPHSRLGHVSAVETADQPPKPQLPPSWMAVGCSLPDAHLQYSCVLLNCSMRRSRTLHATPW